MAECLKLLNDLKQLSQFLEVTTLRHFFAKFDPASSKALRETISHFHMRDLEASDYRSAYHQFCDWLYGWNVSDAAEFADLKGITGIAQYLNQRRAPREIIISSEREKAECQRLLKTFETLFSLSRRQLKKFYMEVEDEMPRLGQGLDTLSVKKPKSDGNSGTNEIAGGAGGGTGGLDGPDDNQLQEMDDDDQDKVWNKEDIEKGNDAGNPTTNIDINFSEEIHDFNNEQNSANQDVLDKASEHPANGSNKEADPAEEDENDEDDTDNEGSAIQKRGMMVRRRSVAVKYLQSNERRHSSMPRPHKTQQIIEETEDSDEMATTNQAMADDSGIKNSVNNEQIDSTALETEPQSGTDIIEEKVLSGGANADGGFSFLGGNSGSSNTPSSGQGKDTRNGPNLDDDTKALQRDVNHIMAEIDRIVEYSLVSLSSLLVILTFSELMEDKDNFTKYSAFAHELSMDFVSNTLKAVWDVLNREVPSKISLASLRDPNSLKDVIRNLLEARAINGVVPKYRMRKLHFKFTTFHDILTAFDIHVFPNFVSAHKEGLKCAQSSAFDQNLWLTGGYDCVVRIFDIRASNAHICLSQYVGHKSIITDVHFTKNDSSIVSSSFDRTIKIWNSQTATCDRTLIGHTDAVTCCAVTPDARYIASGSTDCTVRFWDYNTGDIISVIKKHTRWIKSVRFSPDGRVLATAGLDRKVYLWDTKILANSRSPTHSRCFDSFGDYVLDMVLTRPSLLITTSRDSMIKIFDYMTGHELFQLSLAPSWACTVAVSENGHYFATGSFDNNILVFRTSDFTKIREIRAFNLGIMCVRFPKNDVSYIAAGTSEGFLQQIPL